MISWHDCIALCGFNEAEVRAIAEHEHVPDVVAAGPANSLLKQTHGIEVRPAHDCRRHQGSTRQRRSSAHAPRAARLPSALS